MISFIVSLLPTLIAAWIGWRWKRWRGVVIAVATLWLVSLLVAAVMLSSMQPTLQKILENYPAPS